MLQPRQDVVGVADSLIVNAQATAPVGVAAVQGEVERWVGLAAFALKGLQVAVKLRVLICGVELVFDDDCLTLAVADQDVDIAVLDLDRHLGAVETFDVQRGQQQLQQLGAGSVGALRIEQKGQVARVQAHFIGAAAQQGEQVERRRAVQFGAQ